METSHTHGTTGEYGRMTSVFRDKDSSERVYQQLRERGYSKDEVDVIMSDETRDRYYKNTDESDRSEMGDKAMEGAGVGSAIGGTIGAVVGAVAAIGTSLALPGLGLVIAGPIAAALAGAGAGGLTGGLLGALVGSGIPEEDAKEYEHEIKSGGTGIAFKPRNEDDARHFQDVFSQHSSNRRVYGYDHQGHPLHGQSGHGQGHQRQDHQNEGTSRDENSHHTLGATFNPASSSSAGTPLTGGASRGSADTFRVE